MNIDDPGRLADFIAGTLPSLSTLLRQELIETSNVRKRLEMLIRELSKNSKFWSFGARSTSRFRSRSAEPGEYLLREQMKAIQKELGEIDDAQAEIDELRKRSTKPA